MAIANVSDVPYTLADATTNRLIAVAPLTTTYVWMTSDEMGRRWRVTNVYIRPDRHLEIQPLSLLK